MANELGVASKFIHTKLAADASTSALVSFRIYQDRAPEGVSYPFIVFSNQSGFDSPGLGTVRLLSNPVFQIKGVVEGGQSADLRTLADRIDILFQNYRALTFESYVFTTRRLQPILFTEDQPGKSWTHMGGLYRFNIHPTG